MGRKSKTLESTVVGISPLGGNGIEGTGDGMAEVRNTAIQKVPLFWDSRVSAYISEQAIDELDDREKSEQKARVHQDEIDFHSKAGYGNNQ